MAGEVDQREQEIAGLGRKLVLVGGIKRGFDLVGFFPDLVQHRARIVPVETDGGRLALQFHRAGQRGQARLDACKQGLVLSLAAAPCGTLGLLLGLDALPGADDAGGWMLPSLSANTCG